MSNSSIQPIDRTLSGVTALDKRGPGSDGNEGYSEFPKATILHSMYATAQDD